MQHDNSINIKAFLLRYLIRLLLTCFHFAIKISKILSIFYKRAPKKGEILLTGTFYSKNWIDSHLYPLAQSRHCTVVKIVSIFPIPESDKIKVFYPSKLLRKVVGDVPARLLTFLWVGVRQRPALVGGFHLLFNGLAAAFLGSLIQARSAYFCVGGPAEVLGGGISSENRLFGRLNVPDAYIEQQLINSLKYFSIIITMGTSAVTYFKQHGVQSDFHAVAGGIDSKRFSPTGELPDIDLISVGRMEPVKRFDIFIKAVAEIKKRKPAVKAVLIGDGSLGKELRTLTEKLKLEENIFFPGAQSNVEEWLQRSKIFILTSDSEGLSLAMMEAMMCGLPAVVSDVGDLGDLVEDNKNGFLITQRSPLAFATAALDLLMSRDRLQVFSQHARTAAMKFSQEETIIRWDNILEKHAQIKFINPRVSD